MDGFLGGFLRAVLIVALGLVVALVGHSLMESPRVAVRIVGSALFLGSILVGGYLLYRITGSIQKP
ncbi:MAG: hypothetical protein ABW040_06575 [Microbacteriaceae bacterium]